MSIGSVVKGATLDYLDYLDNEEEWTEKRKEDYRTGKLWFTAELEIYDETNFVLGTRNGIHFVKLTGLPLQALIQPVFTLQGGHDGRKDSNDGVPGGDPGTEPDSDCNREETQGNSSPC